ncbi:MAG: MBL fold metallo-hydrolase [Candidatus Aminicenantes bacterium]|nr:MAG: MBL fold metallo-hydrolase [Candidatus Aminicenantes bacterium]
MTIDKISLGKLTIYGLRDGYFYLDGGSMFGVVPKVLWEKIYAPDEQNRIKMGLNSLLVKTEQALVLIETGIGPGLDQKFSRFYSVEREPGLLGDIKNLGFNPEDIDYVINTHLHFDHCGGNTFQNKEGEWMPAFPKARYIIQKGEWEYALEPCFRDKPSYIQNNFLPLEEHGCLWLVEGNTQITQGVEVLLAPGHTSHHQCVKISSGNEVVFFLGDMVPMSAHASLSYIMSYDLYPLETLANKKKYFECAIAEHWIVAFVHDAQLFFGRINKKDNKYSFVALT